MSEISRSASAAPDGVPLPLTVNEGMGENTLRALTSDLAYLQAWSLAATSASLTWPAPEALLLKFVAHHLWQPEQREIDPLHGMPAEVEQSMREQRFLRSSGPHAPDTVRRRLASWSTLTKWRGLTGVFSSPSLKSAIRLAVRATPRPRKRKSGKAVTGDRRGDLSEIERVLKFSGHSLRAGLASSADVDERYVQKQLGHASAEMTADISAGAIASV
jgi:integrase